MRDFFGELVCECQSFELTRFAITTPDGVMEVSEIMAICIDCNGAFYDLVDGEERPALQPS